MLLLLLACATSDDSTAATDSLPAACVVDGEHTAGWGALTHDNAADPDYGYVFDRSSVLELTITVSADDYAAMNEEVADEATGGAPGDAGAPPDLTAALEACDGLEEGDACEIDGMAATCEYEGPGGELVCFAEGAAGGGGAPTDLISVDPSYVPVTVTVGDSTWCYVGMRYKGNSTLDQAIQAGSTKLPFRLDFDKFEDDHPEVDDQRFYGFGDLSFGNGAGDNTYARDVLASIILEDRGVPAARNRFAAVSLDAGDGPVYLGLYTVSEDPSDAFTDRVWGEDDGVMYKPDGSCATLTCVDDTTFEVKMNEDTGQAAALVDALAADRTDAAAWRSGLEATLDVDGFLRWLAVNSAIENWDSYGTMGHNYYLYAPAGGAQLAWIPWDHNLSLMDGQMGSSDPLLADITDEWPLIRYTLDDEVYAATYRAALTTALEGAYEEEAFQATAETYRTLIEPYALAEGPDSTFLTSEADWDTAWEDLYDHVSARRTEVLSALE